MNGKISAFVEAHLACKKLSVDTLVCSVDRHTDRDTCLAAIFQNNPGKQVP